MYKQKIRCGITIKQSIPGVLNPRAADRHRSVAKSVPGRTKINWLFQFYLLTKSGRIIKGESLIHLQLVTEEEDIMYKCKLQEICNRARLLLTRALPRLTIRMPAKPSPPLPA